MDKQAGNNEPFKRNINTPENEENKQEQTDAQENVSNEDSTPEKKHTSAASLDAIISSPTANVHARHKTESWGNTGTNISYEGQTAPGGMGSVGTGQASGQDATGATIHTSDTENVTSKKEKKEEDDDLKE